MAKKAGFEDRLAELEQIVASLEDGELSLEQAVEHYQKGIKLHRELRGHLERMEKRIEQLTADDRLVDLDDGDPATEDED
ncbi:MAG: exodeoxyribonuclease VII small subunit [Planctomycetes bacterium]|nr:exodeoxyribonuclease VII small subunit [Planctomycetota bacterium]